LTNADQGTKEYTVKAASELTVDAVLSTYGPAEMWIKDADGKELLSWKRSNDSDPALSSGLFQQSRLLPMKYISSPLLSNSRAIIFAGR